MKHTNAPSVEHWLSSAMAIPAEQVKLPSPIHVLTGEAVDVSNFVVKYWKAAKDAHTHKIVRPGLEQARKSKGGITAHIAAELLSLGEAVQHAQTAYLLASGHTATPDLYARGEYIVGEITAVLEYYFDDGVEDANDAKLASVEAAHASDPHTQDALASALDDYAGIAEPHKKDLDGLGGFDAAVIPEARTVAKQLRDKPSQANAESARSTEASNALDVRNRMATLLAQRMATVRNAARFVFRNHPEIAREAGSAYERRKRAESRRKHRAASEPGAATTTK